MPNSTNLGLPFIDANQNQKHVTVNTALQMLDALVQIQVQSAALTAPPGSPADGQAWIVGAGATGAWLGKDLQIAAWQSGAWAFFPPKPGYIAYNVAGTTSLMWTGSAWSSLLGTITMLMLNALGIGTAADGTNPLSVLANTALFNAKTTGAGGTGDMRVKLSKQAAANTASLLFQDALSGRAEIGLTADDNFHFKVSPDGTTFRDALVLNASTGDAQVLSLNGGPLAGLRNRLINGTFQINQRGVSGTVTLAAGAYGHDRFKAGASGCTYTFATSGIDTTATISAGTLTQIIEAANVEGGTYTLSWSGTAQARIYQGAPSGSYAASPITVTGLSANTNTTVEFTTGTLGKVQFEPGTTATPFERRPIGIELQMCERYFRLVSPEGAGVSYTSTSAYFTVRHRGLRAAPTASVSGAVVIVGTGGGNITQSSSSVSILIGSTDVGIYQFGNFTGLVGSVPYLWSPSAQQLQLSAEL